MAVPVSPEAGEQEEAPAVRRPPKQVPVIMSLRRDTGDLCQMQCVVPADPTGLNSAVTGH